MPTATDAADAADAADLADVADSTDLLVHDALATLAVPRRHEADSFVLHAPLEVMARIALIRHVPAARRGPAYAQLARMVERYRHADEPAPAPAPVDGTTAEDAAARMVSAIAAGDLEEVDRWAAWLSVNTSAVELSSLMGPHVVRSLAAAGHAPIFFQLLSRLDGAAALVRGPVRELARHPDLRLSWFDRVEFPRRPQRALVDALLDVPSIGLPGSNFINPLMRQAEDSGIAERLLSAAIGTHMDGRAAAVQLARVAALSMLQESTEHAAFGWTHCLTMPQAVMSLVSNLLPVHVAVGVAATFVAGFRAGEGEVVLDVGMRPNDPGCTMADLAAGAAAHGDAHLVKYTLACIDAAALDPRCEVLYRAAAARLADHWAQGGAGLEA